MFALLVEGSGMRMALLEDDVELGQAVVGRLVAAGHRVEWFTPTRQAEAHFAERAAAQGCATSPPDLLLLDLKPPNDSSLELLQRLRAHGVQCPVIVLAARDQVSDRIGWQQAGADDCLVHPFDLDEMLARIDAMRQRRAEVLPQALQVRELSVDFDARIARCDGERVPLASMEWALLICLARRPGRICNRAEIELSLSGEFGRAQRASNSVEVIVSRLRRKLGSGLITTHRGQGYRLQC
jgi:two-component system, OmpR family, response regulator